MTMTNSVSYGKPDAGKLHFRFDKGVVVSAVPRHGALLCKIKAAAVVLMTAHIAIGGVTRTVSHSGAEGTYATIQAAVDASGDGDTIVVEASSTPYPVSAQVVLSSGVTIVGSSGNPGDVIIEHPSTNTADYRVFYLDNVDAKLKDITIAGGKYTGTVEHGGGIYITANGGNVNHCIVTNCAATWYRHGGGIYIEENSPAMVDRCIITDCRGDTGGGNDYGGAGLYMKGGTVRNCLIVGNHESGSSTPGGAVRVDGGVFENCTVGGNDSTMCAGVVAKGGVVRNCLIGACTSSEYPSSAKATWDGDASKFENCVADVYINDNCTVVSVPFVDANGGDWYPAAGSASVDGATQQDWMTNAVDLPGNDRIRGSGPDIGAYESDPEVFSASFTADAVEGFAPLAVVFTVSVTGAKGAVACKWDWDGDGIIDEILSGLSATHTFGEGFHSVKLTVADDGTDHPLPAALNVHSAPGVINVAAGGDITAALTLAINGTSIVLASGKHEIPAEISVEKGVTIRGATGNPADVVVEHPATNTTDYRIFKLTNADAVLKDLTVSGGRYTKTTLSHGGGIHITANGGNVNHCIITNCHSTYYSHGGGIYIAQNSPAKVDRCIIIDCCNSTGNASTDYGGAGLYMAGGTVRNCLIVGNHESGSPAAGGAVRIDGGVFENCTVGGNDGTKCAGIVARNGTVRNCIVSACTSSDETSPEAIVWSGTASYFTHCVAEAAINDDCRTENAAATFVCPAKGNYRLKRNSEAVDFGANDEWMLDAVDLRGRKRILNAAVDAGCYERGGGAAIIFL